MDVTSIPTKSWRGPSMYVQHGVYCCVFLLFFHFTLITSNSTFVTQQIAETCQRKYGRAHGKLLEQLTYHMDSIIGEKEFQHLQENSNIGISYTEIYPTVKSHLQTSFKDRQDLFNAVKYSCMFPFFTDDKPWLMDRPHKAPTTTKTTRSNKIHGGWCIFNKLGFLWLYEVGKYNSCESRSYNSG